MDVFLDNKGDDFVFLGLFGDFKAFDFLKIVASDDFLGGDLDFLDFEGVVDKEQTSVKEEPFDECAFLRCWQNNEFVLNPFFFDVLALLFASLVGAHHHELREVLIRLKSVAKNLLLRATVKVVSVIFSDGG